MGVAIGWVPATTGQVWDRVYPDPKSPRADLSLWTPDVVFVNLGENDDSFTRAHKMPFPAGYSDGYVALVQAIRAAHPAASIVLLRGGMFGGSQSEPLRLAWTAAVSRLEAADPRISHFVFRHWTSLHPRVADHRAMADELSVLLAAQPALHGRLRSGRRRLSRHEPCPGSRPTLRCAGGIGVSAAAAALPLAILFVCLGLLGMKVSKAAVLALAAALCLAVLVWGMPARLAALAGLQGAAFGMFPVFYIVLATLFLYNITIKGGQFEIIRSSLAGVTPDRRLQALMIAFCFGAFIEGAAGFGAPVAIAGATLVGLGFRPLYAAGLCLVANTAPVAFGTIGIPIVAMGGVMGLNDAGVMRLSAMVGHQLPFISVILPAYLILIMAGPRRTLEVLPAVAVCGVTFAACQWAVASYLGPYLPDLLSSLAAMAALLLLLRFWKPRTTYSALRRTRSRGCRGPQVFRVPRSCPRLVPLPGDDGHGASLGNPCRSRSVAEQGDGHGACAGPGQWRSPGRPTRAAELHAPPVPLAARKFKVDYLASGGTAVLIAALASALVCGIGAGDAARLFGKTLHDMRYPALTIASVLALAYVMNASGMTSCLGVWFTRAGRLFPLLSPILGWLGVFLTGSDTSSNILFGGLQKSAATRLGIDPILTAAANTSGGVMGKMISPQSLAVACAATGIVGDEAKLLRFTLRHSLFLLLFVAAIVGLQAFWLTWMIPA